MVRAPCCDKMGLRKGPWLPDEDRILVEYINRHGHGNWRALPKQAGLLRCGKSCRLRWTNYLRPDIKRGNFTREEEDTIISLHRVLGNRWSAIAAQLPGRTDNEIKNVWHTHLKKRVNSDSNPAEQETKPYKRRSVAKADAEAEAEPRPEPNHHDTDSPPGSSYSGGTSSCSAATTAATAKDECTEEFWLDALSMNSNIFGGSLSSSSPNHGNGDDMSFWLKLFMESEDSLELIDI